MEKYPLVSCLCFFEQAENRLAAARVDNARLNMRRLKVDAASL